jgi:hypothetical protein
MCSDWSEKSDIFFAIDQTNSSCMIWGFHSLFDKGKSILGYDAVLTGNYHVLEALAASKTSVTITN